MRIVKIRPFGPIRLAFQVGISQWRKRRGIKNTRAELTRNIQNTAPNIKYKIQNPPSSQIAKLKLRKNYLSYKDVIYHGAKKRDLHIQELRCFQQTTYGRGSIPTSKYLVRILISSIKTGAFPRYRAWKTHITLTRQIMYNNRASSRTKQITFK